MRSTRHGEHLVRLCSLGLINAYLVREDDGLTLVDTMIPGSAKGILAAAVEQRAPIRRIVLTHVHLDHVGALDPLADAIDGVEVLVSARDARPLAGDRSLDPGEPDAKLRGRDYPTRRTRPTRTLEAGDRIGSLEVHAAPGHTPGQIALLDTRDRSLIVGDAFSSVGGVATSAKLHPRFPFPAMATWHRPTALETARALRTLDPARMAPGHGGVVEAPAAAMDAAIARGT